MRGKLKITIKALTWIRIVLLIAIVVLSLRGDWKATTAVLFVIVLINLEIEGEYVRRQSKKNSKEKYPPGSGPYGF